MSDLVVFLRARLDDDEAMASENLHNGYLGDGFDDYRIQSTGETDAALAFVQRFGPAHVLAEIDAKRAFIEDTDYVMRSYENDNAPDTYGGVYACEQMLKRLAGVYAAHPDYREEWRP